MKNKYSQAVELINDGEIEAALIMVESLSFDRYLDFLLYCKEKRPKQFVKALFWISVSKSKYSLDFFKFSEAHFILADYFNADLTTIQDEEFVLWLADNYPELLIRCLRVSRLLLDENRYSTIKGILATTQNEEISLHFKCMGLLQKIEQSLWEKVVEKSFLLKAYQSKPIQLLNTIALWNELTPNEEQFFISQDKIKSISIAIEFLLTNNFLKNIKPDFEYEEYFTEVVTSIDEIKNYEEKSQMPPIFEWLDCIYQWVKVYYNLIEVYLHDLNFVPVITNESCIYLLPVNTMQLTEWQKTGHKINLMFYHHYQTADYLYEEMPQLQYSAEKAGDLLPEEFKQKTCLRFAAEFAWMSLFDDYVFHLKNIEVEVSNLIRFFSDYSINCYSRWSRELDLHKSQNGNYLNANHVLFAIIKKLKSDIDISSLRLDSFNRLADIYKASYQNVNAEQIISLFTYDLENESNKIKEFNRFNIAFDIWTTPFIKTVDNLLIFSSIIADTRPHTFLFNNLLLQNRKEINQKKLSEKFEDCISDKFQQSGFNTYLSFIKNLPENESVKTKNFLNQTTGETGDIDTLAYKDGYLFVVEAKLSYIRATLGETSREYATSLLKAASQLNKLIRYIKDNFAFFKKALNIVDNEFGELKIIPLIISSSFENDRQTLHWGENSYLKISWHELSLILDKEKNASKIFEYINTNEVWNILDSLPKVSVTEKRIPVGFIEKPNMPNSADLHDKAMVLFQKKMFAKAIPLLKQAIMLDAEYADTYVLIADCYAFNKQTKLAEEYYLLAIEKDSYYARAFTNYGVFLQQHNRHKEAMSCFINALKLSPLDPAIQKNAMAGLNNCLINNIINEIEFESALNDIKKIIDIVSGLEAIRLMS